MRPEARIAAAIDILDAYLSGTPAEQALTNWTRRSRFAGAKDRAAIRDHVFDAIRNRASFAALGGGLTGRGLMVGMVRTAGTDPATVFTGAGYAPDLLTPGDTPRDMTDAETLDCPDWLLPLMRDDLGDQAELILTALKSRAPVHLRANLARTTRDAAIAQLASEQITSQPHALCASAIEVTENARRVTNGAAYREGLVDLQDAGSQWITEQVPTPEGPVLDMCAGGGGKALALASRLGCDVICSDIEPRRMSDIPIRAERQGLQDKVSVAPSLPEGPFDVIVCDVPCSGSGAWRRDPQGKWALTPARLNELQLIQAGILDSAVQRLGPGGRLVYMTCSLLRAENHQQIAAFLDRYSEFGLQSQQQLTPLDGGDGFYVAVLENA